MAKTVTLGPNGTAVSGVPAVSLSVDPLNFEEDFYLLKDDPGDTIYSDGTSPVDQPATVRIATRDNANVYAGTSIDPSAFLSSRKGRDVVIQVRDVARIDDSEDATYLRMFPISAGLTISAPIDANVTPAIVQDMIERIIAAAAAATATPLSDGLSALLRGVTRKKD